MHSDLEGLWPFAERLGFTREQLEQTVGPRLEPGASLDLEGLCVAAGCLLRLPAALAELDGRLLPDVRETLLRRASGAVVDDVLQHTRVKLLLASPPGLAQFAGRGPLQGFLRTVAVRVLSNLEAAVRPTESDDALAHAPDAAELEAGLVGADQQRHFQESFRVAITKLEPRQRALLRLNLLDGLSIDEIAPLYAAHRSSIARWLAEAREALARETRAQLMTRLQLDGQAVDSLLRSVQERFELSLASALRQTQS